MDFVIRSFWWGHEQEERKLHLLSWDKVSQPKRFEGQGLNNFKTMNQVMLTKQFWRINYNPLSLLAKTYKAKYFRRCSIQDCRPKPHHSCYWKNIIKQRESSFERSKMVDWRWFSYPFSSQKLVSLSIPKPGRP